MVSRQITIVNRDGFHMRAAGDFANKSVNGKSIMHLIASGFQKGTELTIQCEGPDEEAQLDSACAMIASGFGEA